ncbi:TPA: hypothetical protein IAC10_11475 [Candidatus Scatousia excrementigallinarum]|uniref:Uncharacterized protein n=1 Tax=Candidatus Scatousia excrementigallinarum TaxID=2840935 RepID=A0A9D1F114_9BACT|nr:hypothetical protein [Candidatus Scatousia excrementigallinarum]
MALYQKIPLIEYHRNLSTGFIIEPYFVFRRLLFYLQRITIKVLKFAANKEDIEYSITRFYNESCGRY